MAITDQTTATTAIENCLGDQDAETLPTLIAVFWSARTDKAVVIPGLQYAYTLRDCCDVLLGQVWPEVDTMSGDEKKSLSQKRVALQQIRNDTDSEIKALEARACANRAPVAGTLSQTAPRDPWPNPNAPGPWGWPNPNDPAYRGDAIRDAGTPEDVNF